MFELQPGGHGFAGGASGIVAAGEREAFALIDEHQRHIVRGFTALVDKLGLHQARECQRQAQPA